MSDDLKAILRSLSLTAALFVFGAVLAYCSAGQAAEERPDWPRWGVVLYSSGLPIMVELTVDRHYMTQAECKAAANVKSANAARAGIASRWRCQDLAQWMGEAI